MAYSQSSSKSAGETPKASASLDTLETHYSGLERMRPHGCYEGFVFIGHLVVDEDGEPTEKIERVPCRRCHAHAAL
jgi:hypothetical protein